VPFVNINVWCMALRWTAWMCWCGHAISNNRNLSGMQMFVQLQRNEVSWKCCSGCERKSHHAHGLILIVQPQREEVRWKCCSGCELKTHLVPTIYCLLFCYNRSDWFLHSSLAHHFDWPTTLCSIPLCAQLLLPVQQQWQQMWTPLTLVIIGDMLWAIGFCAIGVASSSSSMIS
jgi:hypothetical protein